MKIILWSADWCGPCQSLKKSGTVDKLAKHFDATLEIRNVELPRWEKAAEELGVKSLPTVDLWRGEKLLARALGAESLKTYVKRFTEGEIEKEEEESR